MEELSSMLQKSTDPKALEFLASTVFVHLYAMNEVCKGNGQAKDRVG